MNHPDRCYQEQYERVRMLLQIIESEDISKSCPSISYYELSILCFQAIWNLKDWVLNDPNFEAKDIRALKAEIHDSELLRISADIANGTKHFRLDKPRTDCSISDVLGVHVDVKAGIFKQYIRILSASESSQYHGCEVRDFLRLVVDEWSKIIDKHYLSKYDPDD